MMQTMGSIKKGFYDDYDGSAEKVDKLDAFQRGCVVMNLGEAIRFSGVPEKEWRRLIAEHKIQAEIDHEYDRVTLWYNTVKNIKHWWEKYQEEMKGS